MSELMLIRHGRTAWNDDGRLTGRADIPLTEAGRAQIAAYRLPAGWADAAWHVSPLVRARETVALLGHDDAVVEPRLIEMDFGAYEGRTIDELRATLGAAMTANEARGLDFLPPGGESPRMVQARLGPFLCAIGRAGGRHVAVAHKSVIRCIYAMAYDWAMLDRPPVRLRWNCAHVFGVGDAGVVSARDMNVPLSEP